MVPGAEEKKSGSTFSLSTFQSTPKLPSVDLVGVLDPLVVPVSLEAGEDGLPLGATGDGGVLPTASAAAVVLGPARLRRTSPNVTSPPALARGCGSGRPGSRNTGCGSGAGVGHRVTPAVGAAAPRQARRTPRPRRPRDPAVLTALLPRAAPSPPAASAPLTRARRRALEAEKKQKQKQVASATATGSHSVTSPVRHRQPLRSSGSQAPTAIPNLAAAINTLNLRLAALQATVVEIDGNVKTLQATVAEIDGNVKTLMKKVTLKIHFNTPAEKQAAIMEWLTSRFNMQLGEEDVHEEDDEYHFYGDKADLAMEVATKHGGQAKVVPV